MIGHDSDMLERHTQHLPAISEPPTTTVHRTTRVTVCVFTMSKSFPVDNGIPSFWRSQPDTLDNHRSTEALPETSDIVIIGTGFAGASTAYHCLDQSRNTTKPSIVILEARQACSGATGRNGITHALVFISDRLMDCLRWSSEA